MRTIATTLAAMLAVALAASAFAQIPNAFGWERGQAVPESAVVKHGGISKGVKFAYVKPVAGLDEVLIGYTDNLGVCAVVGVERFASRRAYITKWHEKVRKWAEHVVSKFGKIDANPDTWDDDRSTYWNSKTEVDDASPDGRAYRLWKTEKLPVGYRAIQVIAEPHYIRVLFAFDNSRACDPTALLEVALEVAKAG